MPVYEYFCRDCNTKYEKLRPFRDADAPINCPECKAENSVRALSMFIVHAGAGSSQPSSLLSSGGGCACGGACGCGSQLSKN